MEKGGKDGRLNLVVFRSGVGRFLVPRLDSRKKKETFTPPPWKLTYPLKTDGCKMKIPFRNGPFSGDIVLGGVEAKAYVSKGNLSTWPYRSPKLKLVEIWSNSGKDQWCTIVFLQSVGQSRCHGRILFTWKCWQYISKTTCTHVTVYLFEEISNSNLGRLATNCNVEICCPTCALRRCDDTNKCSGDLVVGILHLWCPSAFTFKFQVLLFLYRPKCLLDWSLIPNSEAGSSSNFQLPSFFQGFFFLLNFSGGVSDLHRS